MGVCRRVNRFFSDRERLHVDLHTLACNHYQQIKAGGFPSGAFMLSSNPVFAELSVFP